MKYAWIAEQGKAFALAQMCDVLVMQYAYAFEQATKHGKIPAGAI